MSGLGFRGGGSLGGGSQIPGISGLKPLAGGAGRGPAFTKPSADRPLMVRAFAADGLVRRYDWFLILTTLALTGVGTVLVWAATEPSLKQAGANPDSYLYKQILNDIIGVGLMLTAGSLDYRRFRALTPWVYGIALLLLAAVMTPAGSTVNGAKAWIALPGGFQIEPSEFAKLALVLSTATLVSRRPTIAGTGGRARVGRPGISSVLWAGLAALPLVGLVAIEPALGVTMVLVFAFSGMVVVSGLRLEWIVGALLASAVAVYAGISMHLMKGYQVTRLTAFLHPQQDLAGAGYNLIQAKTAIGSGGMLGAGLFHGSFIGNNYVPSQQTDFIFTVVGEEFGFVGCAVVIGLLTVLIVRAVRIAFVTDDLFGMLVASGIACWFIFQTFVNVGMTIGLAPITGLPLPFVSYGGSAIFADMIAVGLLQSVRRHHSVFE
ncbi:MAG TPA: FtsW/RodA/SpoVE family cell cycle protein [Trebonia sp.]|nr:FtsW/RodA/SpoVE family cell cycle protein [Trebonia sp.]